MILPLDPHLRDIILDRGILALLLAIAAYYFQKQLAKFNSDRQKELAQFNSDRQRELAQFNNDFAVRLQNFKGEQDRLNNMALEVQKQQFQLSQQIRQEQNELAKELRYLQAQKDLQTSAQIAAARLPAYQKFWEIQDLTSPTLALELNRDQRKELENKLRTIFFQNGNGIFLSHSALTLYRKTMECLQDEKSTSKSIKDAFSDFRTQLKSDVKVYNAEEARTPTGPVLKDKGTSAKVVPDEITSPEAPKPCIEFKS